MIYKSLNLIKSMIGDRTELQVQAEFETKLSMLRDWPDRAIILDITKFCEINIAYAQSLVVLLCNKLLTVPSTYKLPLFYLTDSIMKNVGK